MGESVIELDGYDRIRYFFEHDILRNMFYACSRPAAALFLKNILEKGGDYIWELMAEWCKDFGEETKDKKRQYKVSTRCYEGCSMIRIDMPKPERELLCYQVYLVFSRDFRRRGYFTVERGASSEVRFLCSWMRKTDVHCNYGYCSSDASEIEKRIVEIFMNRKEKPFWKRRKIWWCASVVVFIGAGAALCAGRKGRRERD